MHALTHHLPGLAIAGLAIIVLVWRGVLCRDRIWLAVGKTLIFFWVLFCMVLDALFPPKAGAR